jgi:hypothetical protein
MSDRQPNHEEPGDRQLRQLFARMRAEDGDRVPAFPAIEAGQSRAWDPRLVPMAAAAALAIVLAVWLWSPTTSSPFDDGLLLADWVAPSTAFLEMEGTEFTQLGVELDLGAETQDTWGSLPTDILMDQAIELPDEEIRQ